MKRSSIVLAGLATIAALGAAAWLASAPLSLDPAIAEAVAAPGSASAGRIVFFAGGCDSCHMSPGQSDPLRLGGGRELKTPFGSFYPPNISPDPKDGIGAWSAQDFAHALLDGVSPSGEHYYPAFPYTSYRRMSAPDVRDLFAFLRTLPAVAGRAPPHALAFPFTLRRGLGLWKRLFLGPRAFPDAPGRDAAWKLGRYLVEGPGHCAECHSPRNMLGAILAHRRLTGGPLPEGKGKAPDLTAAGLKDWSNADIVEALASGFTPTGDSLGGPMAATVRNTAELPPAYREAIVDYLKSLPAGAWRPGE
ncbi:MAG: cytochrome c [Roseiarcus sp.]|jgi:mono/diheme cytochrome c family protein